ncbi:MAG: protoporphyrinogen oxidase [Anaerolineales bacterium]|uniref:Coproporphyrinogen III oxidase n=1 Tax=Candidatus Desulfolinea nitratireducens TaxID=2841698 RepID=A0A8J6TGS9_9CHLR|nr:protoporphyrinogen oxidase [Candidatus Desulfolinea nitratireducens]MBL6961907.1 protoporphyrinogen oxidase [Anaerolineales bacterium]
MPERKKIIIIGGGITGLSAVWEAQQLGLSYSLIEKDDRLGGKVHTKIVNLPGGKGIIDGGPESFITRKPEAWDLACELGLKDKMVDPGAETRHIFILDGGKPVAVPLAPIAFAKSPLMSLRSKMRMLTEPFQPAKKDDLDESLADFVTRRLGREALDKFIGPILGGIYNTNPDTQSILVSSPIMREMEADYGGLFKAVIGRMVATRKNKKNGEEKRPRFGAFAYGLQELADELVNQLTGDLRLRAEITRVAKNGGNYQITLADGETLSADALIFTTPANVTANLLNDIAKKSAAKLATIRHENIGTVTLIYKAEDAVTPVRIHGLMIPRRENRAIDAITFTSLKMPTRSPETYSMIRVFFGGSRPEIVEMSDADLQKTVQNELRELIGITAEPIEIVPFRWPHSFPQADVGHLDLVTEIENLLPTGVYLAGSSYRGIGVPDCIQQGRQAVKQAQSYLN